jgi:hypothetical protein
VKATQFYSKHSKILGLVLWALFFFSIFAAQQLASWPLVVASGWGGGIAFADLRSVLHAADCSETIGWDIYSPDKWGDCTYIYGSLLIRILRWTNLNSEFTSLIGWVFILFFSILCGFVLSTLQKLSRVQKLASVLILASPCSMLLLERGNIDIVLMFLLVTAAALLGKGRVSLGLVTIALSSLFKFYTLPLMFLLLSRFKNRIAIFVGFLFSGLVTLLVLRDLHLIKGEFPSNVLASFGNQIPWLYLEYVGVTVPRYYGELIGFSLCFTSGFALWILYKKNFLKVAVSSLSHPSSAFVLVLQFLFFCTFLVCFFAGVNYDYRLPYLSIPALLLLNSFRDLNPWFLILPLLIATWASYTVGWLQIFGDCAILLLTSGLIIFVLLLSKRMIFNVTTHNSD